MTAKRLLTAEQVCEQFGVPSPRTVRTMRQQGLAAVRLGKSYLFDPQDVEAFIEAKKECHAQTPAPASNGSKSASATTSCGMNTAGAAFGQLARQTASKLKQPSPISSGSVTPIRGRETQAR